MCTYYKTKRWSTSYIFWNRYKYVSSENWRCNIFLYKFRNVGVIFVKEYFWSQVVCFYVKWYNSIDLGSFKDIFAWTLQKWFRIRVTFFCYAWITNMTLTFEQICQFYRNVQKSKDFDCEIVFINNVMPLLQVDSDDIIFRYTSIQSMWSKY
jgi:hypothetical protein